ncbi:hypothetical protein [Elizabethkingia anophelis]|uniref:hypothetical protein n=1 Tax=Elizabethkingia anophelis TaxID=1117645 RepID=UPI0038914402
MARRIQDTPAVSYNPKKYSKSISTLKANKAKREGFGSGNITRRNGVSGAIKKENKAIANRPSNWTAREAQRAHRRSNARAVVKLKAAGRVV